MFYRRLYVQLIHLLQNSLQVKKFGLKIKASLTALQEHIKELYHTDVSKDLISTITDATNSQNQLNQGGNKVALGAQVAIFKIFISRKTSSRIKIYVIESLRAH
ncbi:hypothetical protein PsorP6_006926 [Peronosclerospora sorghi]|uniref:Uncharacterized protein n=1 Tax=Peronosclerospora sorghi TaxID=230839 RepID=A0ACC0WBH5_9STRA|nr:hypothetical protein PsorP6_006926 [Peronosclerospora sorghi]